MKHLLVVEGPAGSGKSTLIKRIIASDPKTFAEVEHPLEWARPRAYLGEKGVILSQAKDYLTVLGFIRSPAPITIADRWMVSQQVYGAIRRGEAALTLSSWQFHLYLSQGISNISRADYELKLRSNDFSSESLIDFDVVWIFLVPKEPLLLQTRSTVERDFPYSPLQEIPLYLRMYQLLVHGANFSRHYTFHTLLLTPSTMDELDACPRDVIAFLKEENIYNEGGNNQ